MENGQTRKHAYYLLLMGSKPQSPITVETPPSPQQGKLWRCLNSDWRSRKLSSTQQKDGDVSTVIGVGGSYLLQAGYSRYNKDVNTSKCQSLTQAM